MPKKNKKRQFRKILRSGNQSEPVYLNGYDMLATHVGVPTVLVYPNGVDANALEMGFTKALPFFPMMTGRLKTDDKGFLFFDCNDAGMPFDLYQHDEALPSFNASNRIGKSAKQYYEALFPWHVLNKDCELARVELHQYNCGGAVFCFNRIHSICDGSGLWNFLGTVAAFARGEVLIPNIDHRRLLMAKQGAIESAGEYHAAYVKPYSKLSLMWFYTRLTFNVMFPSQSLVVKLPIEKIHKWKEQAQEELPKNEWVATQDLAIAFIAKHSGRKKMLTLFNLRKRDCFEVGDNYMGNTIDYAGINFDQNELNTSSLFELALQCRKQTRNKTDEECLTYAKFLEQHRQNKTIGSLFIENIADTFKDGMIANNYSHFPSYQIDFGQGTASWYEIMPQPFCSLIITGNEQNDGSVYLHFTGTKGEIARVTAAATFESL